MPKCFFNGTSPKKEKNNAEMNKCNHLLCTGLSVQTQTRQLTVISFSQRSSNLTALISFLTLQRCINSVVSFGPYQVFRWKILSNFLYVDYFHSIVVDLLTINLPPKKSNCLDHEAPKNKMQISCTIVKKSHFKICMWWGSWRGSWVELIWLSFPE